MHKFRLKRAQKNAAQKVSKNVREKKKVIPKWLLLKAGARSQEPRPARRQTRKRQPKMISFKGKGQGSTADGSHYADDRSGKEK